MCGLAGILLEDSEWKEKKQIDYYLDKMSDELSNRGPDDKLNFVSEKDNLGFTFRRLSILDLSKQASQPMKSKCGDWIILFNGEIYNHIELKKSFSRPKDFWQTTSDTEVILEYISFYGFREAIPKFTGMFAIVAYCFSTKTLWMARDRFGEKPLYYSVKKNQGFFFSSEIKSFITLKMFFDKSLNKKSITNYLRYGYVPDPLCILNDTFKLTPGTILKYQKEFKIKTFSYWDSFKEFIKVKDTFKLSSYDEAKEAVKDELGKVTKERLISDVPLGAFLSGGIDSSNIVNSIICQGIDISTFSVGFYDNNKNELEFANEIANKLGTKHYPILITEKQCLNEIQNIVRCYDEPFSDPSEIPTFLLSKYAKKKITVALTGDGADELFGGYPRYQNISKYWNNIKNFSNSLSFCFDGLSYILSSSRSRKLRSIGKKIRKLSHLTLDSLYNDEMSRWRPDEGIYEEKYLLKEHIHKNLYCNDNDFSDFRYLMIKDIFRYLPSNLLVKSDRASMFNSLEIRSPFLDHNLAKLVWSLPDKYLYLNGNKSILRDILSEKFKKFISQRPKQGFEPPLNDWIKTSLKDWVYDLINIDDNIFDNKKLKEMFNDILKDEKKLTYKFWTIIMLKAWNNQHFNN